MAEQKHAPPKKGHSKVVFKDYQQNQLSAFPPSLDELIDQNHPVRTVNAVVDKIDLKPLLEKYKGGGAGAFHPRMMLKVLVYSYMTNTYSSRKMERALKENIHFMWLAGLQKPDHNTLARFRSGRLEGVLREVFSQVVLMLAGEGLIDLKVGYTDGTKLASRAGKYTFVWAKGIKTNKEKMKKQLTELLDRAKAVAQEELKDLDTEVFKELDPEKVQQAVDRIDQALKGKKTDKKTKAKLGRAKKNYPEKLREYAKKEEVLDGRNSYSKTDPDATFMRMKDDHLGNGQLKPAYNWQQTTSGQFVAGYSLHQSPGDTTTLKEHLDILENSLGSLPKELCADAGYGSEENYKMLEDRGVEAYVKYNYFHKEDTKKWQEDPFRAQNLHYNEEGDFLVCPMGQRMERLPGDAEQVTKAGFAQSLARYRAKNCAGCPVRGMCHKSKENRTVKVNHNLNRYRKQAKERLTGERGLEHRSNRPQDVEAVFGHIKSNRGFKRFMLTGLHKTEIEIGLLSLAHNLLKKHGKEQEKRREEAPKGAGEHQNTASSAQAARKAPIYVIGRHTQKMAA
jgi:transposase